MEKWKKRNWTIMSLSCVRCHQMKVKCEIDGSGNCFRCNKTGASCVPYVQKKRGPKRKLEVYQSPGFCDSDNEKLSSIRTNVLSLHSSYLGFMQVGNRRMLSPFLYEIFFSLDFFFLIYVYFWRRIALSYLKLKDSTIYKKWIRTCKRYDVDVNDLDSIRPFTFKSMDLTNFMHETGCSLSLLELKFCEPKSFQNDLSSENIESALRLNDIPIFIRTIDPTGGKYKKPRITWGASSALYSTFGVRHVDLQDADRKMPLWSEGVLKL